MFHNYVFQAFNLIRVFIKLFYGVYGTEEILEKNPMGFKKIYPISHFCSCSDSDLALYPILYFNIYFFL